MKNISDEWMKKWKVCEEGFKVWDRDYETLHLIDLVTEDRPTLYWLLSRTLENSIDRSKLCIFCAESGLPMIKEMHPADETAEAAINSMKKWIDDSTESNLNEVKDRIKASIDLIRGTPVKSDVMTAARTVVCVMKCIEEPNVKRVDYIVASAVKALGSALIDIIDYWKILI